MGVTRYTVYVGMCHCSDIVSRVFFIFNGVYERLSLARLYLEQSGNFHIQSGLTLFRLGGGGGAFDATQDLNPLLLTNDCVYSVPQIYLGTIWCC